MESRMKHNDLKIATKWGPLKYLEIVQVKNMQFSQLLRWSLR